MCVFVCVWNFWTEVKPLLLLLFQLSDFSRGRWPTHESTAKIKLLIELGGYRDWSSRRTCKDLTFWTWDVGNPRTTSPNSLQFHFIDFVIRTLPQSGTCFNLFKTIFDFHYTGYGDGSLLILFRVSSPQDAVSPSGNTCLGRMFDPPTWSLNIHF